MNKPELQAYAKRAPRIEKDSFLIKQCADQSVLDVGCIGQDRDFDSPKWLHNKIRTVAKQIVGVDILVDQVKLLNGRGYTMFTPEELTNANTKYDVVLMSDVIEHVDNPVEFLRFYSNFLKPGGKMLVSTPSANRSINFVSILFSNNYSVNPEHTFWFCPRTLTEVADRAKVTISEFYWAGNYFADDEIKGLYQKIKHGISNFLFNVRPQFSPNMMFVITRA